MSPRTFSQNNDQRSVLGLDIVRFAAAAGVVLYHLAWWWWLPDITGAQGRVFHDGLAPLSEPFRWGWVGVQIFFTLSGFVIAFSAHGKTAKRFIAGRVQRLYPAAWICATFTLLAVQWNVDEYLRSITLWIYGPWISGVYWTLSVEMVFYVLVTFVLSLGIRLSTFGVVLGIISCCYWGMRIVDFVAGGHGSSFLATAEGTQTGRLTLLTTGSFFATGIVLWSLVYEEASTWKKCFLVIFVVASLAAVMGAGHYQVATRGGHKWQVLEPAFIWLVALCAIGFSVLWNDRLWNRFGHHAAKIRLAGLTTYPLYLIHSEVGRAIMIQVKVLGAGPSLAVTLIAVLLLAFAVVKLEQYPRQFLRWLFAHPPRS